MVTETSTTLNSVIERMLGECKPLELTDSSPEVVEARLILKGDMRYFDYDFEGSVYWSLDGKEAVIIM